MEDLKKSFDHEWFKRIEEMKKRFAEAKTNVEKQLEEKISQLEKKVKLQQQQVYRSKKKCEEFDETIKKTKLQQWCRVCLKLAKFYCCWNNSYCGEKCQTSDWPKHYKFCHNLNNNNNEMNQEVPSPCQSDKAEDSEDNFLLGDNVMVKIEVDEDEEFVIEDDILENSSSLPTEESNIQETIKNSEEKIQQTEQSLENLIKEKLSEDVAKVHPSPTCGKAKDKTTSPDERLTKFVEDKIKDIVEAECVNKENMKDQSNDLNLKVQSDTQLKSMEDSSEETKPQKNIFKEVKTNEIYQSKETLKEKKDCFEYNIRPSMASKDVPASAKDRAERPNNDLKPSEVSENHIKDPEERLQKVIETRNSQMNNHKMETTEKKVSPVKVIQKQTTQKEVSLEYKIKPCSVWLKKVTMPNKNNIYLKSKSLKQEKLKDQIEMAKTDTKEDVHCGEKLATPKNNEDTDQGTDSDKKGTSKTNPSSITEEDYKVQKKEGEVAEEKDPSNEPLETESPQYKTELMEVEIASVAEDLSSLISMDHSYCSES